MAEKEMGDQFDIRRFHDTVLIGGAMPLEILEAKVKKCVSEVKGNRMRSTPRQQPIGCQGKWRIVF